MYLGPKDVILYIVIIFCCDKLNIYIYLEYVKLNIDTYDPRQESNLRVENLPLPTHRKGGCATRAQIYEPTVVQQSPVSEQLRKHRQRVVCQRLVHKRLLTLQSLRKKLRNS
jgi:hypothetical protein